MRASCIIGKEMSVRIVLAKAENASVNRSRKNLPELRAAANSG
jgi:hypothetical protein